MTGEQSRICTGCGRQIPWDDNFCPNCGWPTNQQQTYGMPYAQPYQQQQQFEPLGGLKYALYLVSFISILIGVVIYLIWMDSPNPERREVGKNCLIISIVTIFLSVLLSAVLYLIILGSIYG
jgi:uncharacterized membrane protein YvbJ